MGNINLKNLTSKLNANCQKSLEAAAGMCLSRSNYYVEIEHWLVKLLEQQQSDFDLICKHYAIDANKIIQECNQSLERQKTGNARPPALSQSIIDLSREAWLAASLEYESQKVRSGYLVYALLNDEQLNRVISGVSKEFLRIPRDKLNAELYNIIQDSVESADFTTAQKGASVQKGGSTKTPALDQYTTDLTEQARQGKIDPIIGRNNEVRQMIAILMRRRQNNPILVGEPGVGKTAVAEGLALLIADGSVPEELQKVALKTLDMGLLQAGAGIKGEFEKRLKSVIQEVKSSPTPIILFIDEAHTLVGAGGQAGQSDAANLMKPTLARGELRTVAATTWDEYKKYFEQDAALTRRFQVVQVQEPDESTAVEMMQGIAPSLEKHHKVAVLDEGIKETVKLSMRYISGRQLPDKAVSLLDTACTRVAISQKTKPATIEDCEYQIEQLHIKKAIFEREQKLGVENDDLNLDSILQKEQEYQTRLQTLQAQWDAERELVTQINQVRAEIESDQSTAGASDDFNDDSDAAAVVSAPTSLTAEAQALKIKLSEIQGESPLMHDSVDAQVIARVVADWTGIPVGSMLSDELKLVLNLKSELQKRVIGQEHVLEAIEHCMKTSRAGVTDPNKPIGVFLLAGPSGVGKTETALALAELLYGGTRQLTVINMSEFKEEHKVSLLLGSPPGYVGYGEGGVLTEAVRRQPYSLILLDEMEKAHPGVQDIFYQVFDKGMLKDGQGRDIDFKNTVIIMTSNAASDVVMENCLGASEYPNVETLSGLLHPHLLKTFKPAFLGRCNVIPYYPLTDDDLSAITELQLGRIQRRIENQYQATFSYSEDVIPSIVSRCQEADTGARNINNILSNRLLPSLSTQLLTKMSEKIKIQAINVTLDAQGEFDFDVV